MVIAYLRGTGALSLAKENTVSPSIPIGLFAPLKTQAKH